MKHSAQSLDRRQFLQASTTAAATFLLGATACGAGVEPSAGRPAQADDLATPTSASESVNIDNVQTETPPAPALRIAMSVLPSSFDPALFENVEIYPIGFAIYDGLVWVDPQLTPQPLLAERWEVSTDGLSWTFHLRTDVYFHHGTAFTATDVVYTFTRLLDPALGSPLQPLLTFIKQAEAVDDHTVRFLLATPNVDLPLLLAAPQLRILPHDYSLERLQITPSGTGPFLFSEFRSGEYVHLTRNPDYWAAERIAIAELRYIHLPSFDDQITALLQDDIDLLLEIDPRQLAQLQGAPDIILLTAPSGRYQNLAMQVKDGPFHDNRVRQALKACIDRPLLQQQVLQGRGEIGYDHPIAAISPFFADLPAQPPNIEKARQLLAEAGYPNGLQLQLITTDAFPGMVQLAYAVQAMTQPAGIKIDVIEAKVPSDIYFSDYWGVVPFYVSAWEFRPSIYETFAIAYQSYSVWNETGWSSPALDKILEDAQQETDQEQRRALYRDAAQLLMTEGAVMIPYFQPVLTAVRRNVQGFTPHPAGWVDLRDVQLT